LHPWLNHPPATAGQDGQDGQDWWDGGNCNCNGNRNRNCNGNGNGNGNYMTGLAGWTGL